MIKVRQNIESALLKIKESQSLLAIYGLKDGTRKILKEIIKLDMQQCVICIIGNDDEVKYIKKFEGYDVVNMDSLPSEVGVIFIGAEIQHRIVKDRVKKYLRDKKREDIIVMNPFEYQYTQEDLVEYVDYLNANESEKSPFYCEENDIGFSIEEGDSKVITWFLPQFHRLEINDRFHGKGFTEWTNTSKTIPQFKGHYQPHIPYDVGYYDLMNPNTLKRQSELAKEYGIYGFGFFFYWFSGKRIMEKPLEVLLENKNIDINFCLHWATEDWSMAWYGKDGDVFLKQEIPEIDAFWKDLEPCFKDERYIKINGMPLLVIYKCETFEREAFRVFIDKLRQKSVSEGYKGIYIMLSTGAGTFSDAEKWGGDALVEYQPWRIYRSSLVENVIPEGYINPKFKGIISDISKAIGEKEYLKKDTKDTIFRSAMTAWDNTARKKESNAAIITGITPDKMKKWLVDIMRESKNVHPKEMDFVFVSSWNEWAEGSHLEPDYKYGYAWLNAVREALIECREDVEGEK